MTLYGALGRIAGRRVAVDPHRRPTCLQRRARRRHGLPWLTLLCDLLEVYDYE